MAIRGELFGDRKLTLKTHTKLGQHNKSMIAVRVRPFVSEKVDRNPSHASRRLCGSPSSAKLHRDLHDAGPERTYHPHQRRPKKLSGAVATSSSQSQQTLLSYSKTLFAPSQGIEER